MITSDFAYIALLTLLSLAFYFTEKRFSVRLFEYLPGIVILYFIVMSLSTLGVWQKTAEITAAYKAFKSLLLPAMIFLMLLSADIRHILKLGKKMLLTFLLASVTICVGFVVSFALLHDYMPQDAWKAFAALAGSWLGGTANMVAVQGALNLPDSAMGYTLLIDSVDYAIWVMILLALVPFASRFNRWSGADTTIIDEVGAKLQMQEQERIQGGFLLYGALLLLALTVSTVAEKAAAHLPVSDFFSHTTWTVLIATVAGIVTAMTRIGRLGGASELGGAILYFIIALIASRANFGELTQAPLYIAAGFVIIGVHLLLMILLAKRFKLDLFSLGVASLANIGGVASAPILASAYSKALIPIGVLMAMLGYIVGTFGGLGVGKILSLIAS